MTQLLYKRILKKLYRLRIVHHLSRSQGTDDSHMKDVLQLTSAIVMASSAEKKI